MPKFNVTLRREVAEETVVEIDANTEADAIAAGEKILDGLGNGHGGYEWWLTDDPLLTIEDATLGDPMDEESE